MLYSKVVKKENTLIEDLPNGIGAFVSSAEL